MKWVFSFVLILTLSSCAGCPYSFTGASVPSDYKTIAIPIFEDVSGFGEPGIREKITEAVVQKFTTDNTLKIADRKISDTILEGSIVNVRDDPSTITGAEKVNTRRITISVKVTFQDLRTRKVIWEKNFSNWGDYDASSFANRQIGFKTAIDKLTEDILIGTVSDW